MKILKIELQNINSLKSDLPIVIDFEGERFKDVGLYAITGSTGAGKTTILDAITIALYHSVPRFKDTKGSLDDVISHNAKNAFSRVTFENKNVLYEAFWGIRVAAKSGKALKNPEEKVHLKNLTTGTILASKKRIFITEIIRVTQLNYNQFLKSVMLAQGEFASFLTAKGLEKGKLLEQITGEQIYKKIGKGILERKSLEDNKLKEIQAKINSDDILTEDSKIELSQKDKILDAEILKIEQEIKATQSIADWYVNFQNLIDESDSLENDSKKIDDYIENHKNELALLDLNEKAEPFRELIQNVNRIEENVIDKANELKDLENQLTKLQPNIDNLNEQVNNHSTELEIAEKEFTEWLPKLDLVIKLDGQLKNENGNKHKSERKLDELTKQIESLKDENQNLSKEQTDTTSKIENEEILINRNVFLNEVALEASNWASELTNLKAKKERLKEDVKFITEKENEVEETISDLNENNLLLDRKIIEIKKTKREFAAIKIQLSENNLTDLLAKKAETTLTESNWRQFKKLAEQTVKAENDHTKLLAQQKSFSTELKSTKKQIEELKEEIKAQEECVADANKILNLEKSISKYEADRRNLIKGEPCGLCGSKEHPFTENLKSINISKSELELNKRTEILNILTNSKTDLEKNEVELKTKIDNLTEQIDSIDNELKAFKSSAEQLNINCELTNTTKITAELNLLTKQIQSIDYGLSIVQQLQTDKDNLSKSLDTQNQSINTLNTTVATLEEKIKNLKSEIENKKETVDSLNQTCTGLESNLKAKLSKFNYKLPSVSNTSSFIENIKESIINFNKKQKNLDKLKADLAIIKTNIDNNKKQLKKHLKTQNEYTKTIGASETKLKELETKRIDILPINITVESKRESLQTLKKQLTEKVKLSKEELQKLINLKTEKEALIAKINKEQKSIAGELSTLKVSLNSQIENSDFESKQEIENALLTKESKLEYTRKKERIKENLLKLKTLIEKNTKAKETLNNSKNFKISEAECKLTLKELNTKNKGFLTEKGKIVEAFRKDKEIRDRNQETYKKIEVQEEVCSVWKELFKVIGNSKDAFNIYVQRLTLKQLLDFANVHLYKLNKRYSLKLEEDYKPKEELNFNLIDHYQTDQVRLVDTSSGGEKFIISLALALGLSDLASKNVKIDSLFIDEGFGTLDKNTLEIVISTLETLQSQGKMIGIISHVENLKERISTQIQIIKKNNGVSTIKIA
ncbi:MAG: AAA family ATPase [Chitinophagales bacterium]